MSMEASKYLFFAVVLNHCVPFANSVGFLAMGVQYCILKIAFISTLFFLYSGLKYPRNNFRIVILD
jgi:hypothetical protein